MVEAKYANAYTEVLEVIKNFSEADYNKIEKKYISFMEKNCNKNYKFIYDKTKSLEEQVLLDNTKIILFHFFEKYGVNDVQREKIKLFRKKYINKIEEEKREKYGSNVIFRKSNNKVVNVGEDSVEMIKYDKGNFFVKIWHMVGNLFNKRK